MPTLKESIKEEKKESLKETEEGNEKKVDAAYNEEEEEEEEEEGEEEEGEEEEDEIEEFIEVPEIKREKYIPSFPFDVAKNAKFEEVRKRQSRLLFPNEADGQILKRPKVPWPDFLLISRINLKHAQAGLLANMPPSLLANIETALNDELHQVCTERKQTLVSEQSLSVEYDSTKKMRSLKKAEERTMTTELETAERLRRQNTKPRKPRGWLMVPMPLYACGDKTPAGDIVQIKPPFLL